MGQVVLKGINKFYDSVHAVKDVNLQIRDKEFVVFVGPSGCGKTTTLRMIAGLEAISSGDISIDGNVVNELAPMDRDIAMVFQNYALYPHMSVYDNMAFGLKMRKFGRPEIEERVRAAHRAAEAKRAAGLPTSGAELNNWYAAVPDSENAALVMTQAFALMRTFPDQRSNEVVRFKLPPRGQRLTTDQVELLSEYVQMNTAALAKAEEHARHFVEARVRQVAKLAGVMDRPPLLVCPYDAELFGHWWYEGPEFIDRVVRQVCRDQGSCNVQRGK